MGGVDGGVRTVRMVFWMNFFFLIREWEFGKSCVNLNVENLRSDLDPPKLLKNPFLSSTNDQDTISFFLLLNQAVVAVE